VPGADLRSRSRVIGASQDLSMRIQGDCVFFELRRYHIFTLKGNINNGEKGGRVMFRSLVWAERELQHCLCILVALRYCNES
jgi:hypothetical protein